MFDQPRKRRRRRIIWPILVTLVVAIGVIVATAGGDARATISYLEEVQLSAQQVARAGATLETLVGDLSRVDRSEFESVVRGVRDSLREAAEVAEMPVPDQELLGAQVLYRLAVDSWSQGIEGFSEAILLAADEPSNQEVIDQLASAVVAVRAGDELYGALLEEFARDDVPSPVGQMPQVRLLPVDTPITVLAPAWVEAARSETSGLAMRPSIRIEQVSTRPEWVQSADGTIVVPAVADTIDLIVVVGNAGNTPTGEASLSLVFAAQGAEPEELTQPVSPIEPGMSTSVMFQDLEVVPGTFYEIHLELDPQGPDTFSEDNRHSTAFLVNEATPTTDTTSAG